MTDKAVDWELSLKISNGKENFAKEMLAMFIDELPEAQLNINDTFSRREYAELNRHAHKLLGGCSYCGIPRFKNITTQIEAATRENRSVARLPDLIKAFNEEVSTLLGEAKQYLEKA